MSEEFDRAVEVARLKYCQTVLRIEMDPNKATIRFTLGCGHEVVLRLANHPLISIDDFSGIEVGNQIDCPHCKTATVH